MPFIKKQNDLEPGQVVKLLYLQSRDGQSLNGRWAIVVRPVPTTEREAARLEVFIQGETETLSIKAENLKRQLPWPLPDPNDPARGKISMLEDDNTEVLTRKLMDWIVEPTAGFNPKPVKFEGPAANAFERIGKPVHFSQWTDIQKESLAAIAALTQLAHKEKEAVMFALLRANHMSLQVICQMIYQTPFVGTKNDFDSLDVLVQAQFRDKTCRFTPDQTSEEYINALKKGPLGLLERMAGYVHSAPFFAAIAAHCDQWNLLVRRLIRIIGREARWTDDGMKLGHAARVVLAALCPVDEILTQEQAIRISRGPIAGGMAETLLAKERDLTSVAAIREQLPKLFDIFT